MIKFYLLVNIVETQNIASLPEFYSVTVPFSFSHCSLVISIMPLPLQEFNPLHALVAVLQELWPLQLLTPAQCTIGAGVAEAAAVDSVICVSASAAVVNKAATAVAMTIPVCFMLIRTSP